MTNAEHSENKNRFNYAKVAAGAVANCWRAHPLLFFGFMPVSALLCAVQVGEIFAMRHLFDSVAEFIGGYIAINDVYIAAIPMAVLLIAFPFINTVAWLGQGYFWRRGSGYLMARYHESVRRVPLIDYEKAGTFDKMLKAKVGSEDAPSASRSILQFAFYFIPYIIFTAVFLISVKPALFLALLITFVSVLVAQILRADASRRFMERNAGLRRRTEYLESCITGHEYVKETRTLGAAAYFLERFAESLKRYNEASRITERKTALVELLLRTVNVLGYAGILAMLVYYIMEGSVSVGAFAAVFYSFERLNGLLMMAVEYFGDFLREIGSASFTYEFLNMPEESGSREALDKSTDIRLDDVSFKYPGGSRNVLGGVTLTIRRGETIAVVGENGAGKSTLINVITGLYNPTAGAVRYGGANIRDYAASSRFKRISAVFQNYVRYKLTLNENILISDSAAASAATEQVVGVFEVTPKKRAAGVIDSHTSVESAAAEAGVRADNLPNGFDTMLSRDFDGAELSGGQWQRVAIARGLYREHDIIVLDEPTAAIDPIEESGIFRKFRDLAKEKTAILVTHRLGSAKIADRIILMDEGTIVEQGTHEQLMEQNGRYAEMFREQAGWYER